MSEFIKNAIEAGIRKAEEERASERARQDQIAQLLTLFEQQVTNSIVPMFEDAKRLFKEKLGKEFDVQCIKAENRTTEVRISEAGEQGKRTFFTVRGSSSGEVTTSSWLTGAPGDRDGRQVMPGARSSGALQSEFVNWAERYAQHVETKRAT